MRRLGDCRKQIRISKYIVRPVLVEAQAPTAYTFRKEALVAVDGTFADAAFGRFGPGDEYVVAVEGKGPADKLDKPYGSRKRTAVEQGMLYAVQLQIDWYLVTNLKETRLYHKGHDTFTRESFETARMATDAAEVKRFVFLLGAERVVGKPGKNHLEDLLKESKRIGRELTKEYYDEFRNLRQQTFAKIQKANPDTDPNALLEATQKILDRVLFIAFCEDRELLPVESIASAYAHRDRYKPRPVWENFKTLFAWVDKGYPEEGVDAYNGGLFEQDSIIDSLVVPNEVCVGFKKLADYEYGHAETTGAKLIDVEILGHIFEQSISDLEGLHEKIKGAATGKKSTKRHKEGAYYTPSFITRYIVGQALRPVLAARFEALRTRHAADATRTTKRVLDDPRIFDPAKLTAPQRDVLGKFWGNWSESLESVRIVDPACGSGAFLIEAFDQMFAEHQAADAYLHELGRDPGMFEAKRAILTNNLFGMDLNAEAVEIARLSLWIKTAERGKKLTALDENVKQGNSVVTGTAPRAAWAAQFPTVFAEGGFDVVIGNPPYVRHELIKTDKPFFESHYDAYDSSADLYVYFCELGLTLLKPGGRLGYIVTNKWLKNGYGAPLRKLYSEKAWVELLIDFGHAKLVFPDADVFPCILIASSPEPGKARPATRVSDLVGKQVDFGNLPLVVGQNEAQISPSRLTPAKWLLGSEPELDLVAKLEAKGEKLKAVIEVEPLSGIKTGMNEAFLLATDEKNKLVATDPGSSPLLKPYIEGDNCDRWYPGDSDLWMLVMKSSANHEWPLSRAESPEMAEETFKRAYPGVYARFLPLRDRLVARGDQGEYWWELRSCAYWDLFDKPKITYPDITWDARFALDQRGLLANNTVYFLPIDDPWVLAALNTPVSWWLAWRTAQHGKDEALRYFADWLNEFPVPVPTVAQRDAAAKFVDQLTDLARRRRDGQTAIVDWLHITLGVDRASKSLQNVAALDLDAFLASVKKARGRALEIQDVKLLKKQHEVHVVPLRALSQKAMQIEQQLSVTVNMAYGLTPEELKLLWDTAPPRMPCPRHG